MLVSINEYDISKHIVSGYNVNETCYYKQKRDGFGRKHRDIVRREVSGNFDLKIKTAEEYEDFVESVRRNTTHDGRIFMQVYVNNTNKVKNGFFFYNYTVKLERDMATGKRYRRFTFTIEEA